MATKKKKKVAKKKNSKKIVSKKVIKVTKPIPKMTRSNKRKIIITLKQLILFAILFAISVLLYNLSNQEMYINLFFILSMLLGFITLAFLIVLLVLVFLKAIKK